jgi:hypothetical protein
LMQVAEPMIVSGKSWYIDILKVLPMQSKHQKSSLGQLH